MQERRRCILLPLMVTVSAVSAGAQNASSPSSCSLSNFGVHPTGYAHTTLTLTWNTLACSWSDVLELKWRYQGDAQWASGIELRGNESAYTVTELTVGSPYDFSLISAIGRADGLTTQGETLSFDKATNVLVRAGNTSGTLIVGWKSATSMSSSFRQQLRVRLADDPAAEWEISPDGEMLSPSLTATTLSFLTPYTFYLVRVDTIFDDERGVLPSRASAQVRTVAGIPVRVKDLRVVNASSSSIRFAWSPLMGSDKGGGGDMQVEYIVEVVSTEREGSGFAMSFPDMDPFRVENAALELRALPANMLFQVRVSAANSAALVGPASAIVSGRTLPTLAQAVAAPDFEYSEGRLTLSWQSLADQQAAGGMPIDSFRIYQRRQDETAFSAILEVPGNGVFNSMIKANISSTSAGYSYEYRVSVVTGAGEGPLSPASPPVVSPLLPPMPSPTVVLTYPADGLSATAFVSWPPAAAGFAARGFVVSLQDRFVGTDTPFDPGIQVLHRNLTFANLTLGKLYAVRVQALSSQPGIRSEVSDAVVFETRDISVPTSVRLSVYTDTTLYVQWVAPLNYEQVESYQVFRVDQQGSMSMTVAAKDDSWLFIQGAVGDTYEVAVQTRFANGAGSRLSLWAPSVTMPTKVPAQMPAPTLQLDGECATCMRLQYNLVVTSPANGGAPVLEYEVLIRGVRDSADVSHLVAAEPPSEQSAISKEFVFTGLVRGERYRVRMRARNVNGFSPLSPYTPDLVLPTTRPDPPTNLRKVTGSDGATSLTIMWDPAPSGNLLPVSGYRLFKLSIENDLDPGTDFAIADTVASQGIAYAITGLRGGVEYTFKIKAINTAGQYSELSEGMTFIAGHEKPLAIKTLRAAPAPQPDLLTHYLLLLTWTIPTQVDETGGTPITGFRLQYTVQDSADFIPSIATWCTTKDGPPPCETADIGDDKDGLLGRIGTLEFAALKGTIYHFRISAINKEGEGPWGGAADYGTLSTPRYITRPPQPPAPTVVPKTDTNMHIDWEEYDRSCTQCYETKTVNGGRLLTHIEVNMKINGGPWFLYGERVTNVPLCDAQTGDDCLFRHYVVPAPGGLLRQKDLDFQRKRIEVGTYTMSQRGFYQFRLRSSNDNMTTWSDWSPTGSGTTLLPIFNNVQVSGFPHHFQGLPTPTGMTLRWYSPTGLTGSNLLSVDNTVFFGYEADTVYWDQKAEATVTVGSTDTAPSYAGVTNLIPDTVYYFRVVGINEQQVQLNMTRSNATAAARTAIGKPSSQMAVSVYESPNEAERIAGYMYVEWSTLPPECNTGSTMTDGSIDGCPRGRAGNLEAYRMYVRLHSQTEPTHTFQTTWDVNRVVVTGLDKGKLYCFSVAAVNIQEEGEESPANCTEALRTPPGPPPRPSSPAASLSALRISFQQPADVGAFDGEISEMLLHMSPGRSLASEEFSITWQRSLVVTGLPANTYFHFTIQAKNNLLDIWSIHSDVLYAKTTSHPPEALRLRGNAMAETGSVDLEWDAPAPPGGQGNLTLYGYRVLYRALQPTLGPASGEQLCSVTEGGGGCSVAGLSAGTSYEIKVGTCTDAALLSSFGPPGDPLVVTTAVRLPTVSVPQLSELESDSVLVSWIVDSGGLPLQSATLYTKLENEPLDAGLVVDLSTQDSSVGAQQRVRVYGLGPALEYRFLVRASNSLGESSSQLSSPVLTLPAAPPMPQAVSVSTQFVVIRWEIWSGRRLTGQYRVRVKSAPTESFLSSSGTAAEDSAYEVSQRMIREANWTDAGTVDGRTSQLQVDGLQGGMQVQLQVAAYNGAGWGPWSQSAVTETLPTSPTLVLIQEVRATEVELRWTPPAGALLIYSIEPLLYDTGAFRPQTPVLKEDGRIDSHVLTGLLKGRTYAFRVAVRLEPDDDGLGGGVGDYSAVSNSVKTLSTLPSGGPAVEIDVSEGVSGAAATSNSLRVRWDNRLPWQTTGGAVIDNFWLEWRYPHNNTWTLSKVVRSLQGAPASGQEGSVADPADPIAWQSTVVTDLDANTRYIFRIRAENFMGVGPPGPESLELITLPPPLPPPRMIASLNSIVLTWDSGNYEAFDIRHARFVQGTATWTDWEYVSAGKGESSLLLSNLLRDTTYRTSMAARNVAGSGQYGPIQVGRTTLTAPPLLQFPFDVSSVLPTSARLNWFAPPIEQLASSLGYAVFACTVDDADGVELLPAARTCELPPEQLSQCGEFPEALAHTCVNTESSFVRQGLRKNTRYTMRLSVVNPGGTGPPGEQSSIFKTASSFPEKMAAPVGRTESTTIISVRWDPVVDWNRRGGLDMIAYYLAIRPSGGSYSPLVAIYPMNAADPAETQYTFTGLQPNTVYFVRVFGENTACTLLEQEALPTCCEFHECSTPSDDSEPVATLLAAMPMPFLGAATEDMILVRWPAVDGTPGNLASVEIEYQDADRASKDASDVWLSTHVAGSQTSVWLTGLRPNNRYTVRLRGTDTSARLSPFGETNVLVTRPLRLAPPRVVAVEATSVSLEWDAPLGRAANIIGFNISIFRHSVIGSAESFVFIEADGSVQSFRPSGLIRDSQYSFSISPTNDAGDAVRSNHTEVVGTLLQDALAACTLYPVWEDNGSATSSAAGASRASAADISADFFLFRASGGIRIAADVSGLVPTVYSVVLRPYGLSAADNGGGDVVLEPLDARLTLAEEYANKGQDPSYRVTRYYSTEAPPEESLSDEGSSRIGASLLLVLPASSTSAGVASGAQRIVARCELGIARPRAAAQINSAVPRQERRAFCVLQAVPDSPFPQLTGTVWFDAGELPTEVRVQAKVCGVPSGNSLPLALHEYGDLGSLPTSLGAPLVTMGAVSIDNLGSGFLDDNSIAGLSLDPLSSSGSVVGRGVALTVSGSNALAAACVVGSRNPDEGDAVATPCTPCTHSLLPQQSLYNVASYYGVSWLSVWSLNLELLSPDIGSQPGLSIFYAHAIKLGFGQTPRSVASRFGMSDEQLLRLNPYIFEEPQELSNVAEGLIMCVSPNWRLLHDRMGSDLCGAA